MLRRVLRISLVMALGAVLLAGCGDDDDDGGSGGEAGLEADYDITGTWSGKLSQEGVPDFRVTATISSLDDGSQNTVHYSGIDCRGNWTFQKREDAAFLFREVIDRGEGGECKGVGEVRLVPFAADGVDYTFRGGGVESAGVLRRK